MMAGNILVLDFGSQYSHLIVRRCREINVYGSMKSCFASVEQIFADNPNGIILSGGPSSVYEANAPHVCKSFWEYVQKNKIPLLGICYGMQEMMHALGGKIGITEKKEYGTADLLIKGHGRDQYDELFVGISSNPTKVWMSHGDCVKTPAPGFEAIALTVNAEYAAVSFPEHRMWGLQFHPEVTHTADGSLLLRNFCVDICGVQPNWTMNRFALAEVKEIHEKVGDNHVLGALSGGVDSTVAAALVYRAIGDRFHGFLIDTGMLRKSEASEVIEKLKSQGLRVDVVDAGERFLAKLKNVSDPEEKRKIIGQQFIEEFQNAAKTLSLPSNTFLLQGTLYPDVIESKSHRGPSHVIKTHHNVGGLPEKLNLRVIEPLRELFKDEVRALGEELGLSHNTVWRHPFPGPGLAIRIIGAVTAERVAVLQQADCILLEEIRVSGDYEKIGQAFVVLLPDVHTVGVMGDQRTYEMTAVIRAVSTTDYMTADWYRLSYDVMAKCSSRIVNEVQGINRVCYDITSKPPGTIEWE